MKKKIYPGILSAFLLCLLLLAVQTVLGLMLGVIQAVLHLGEDSILTGILTILVSIISFGIVLLIGFKKTKRNFNEVFKFNGVSPILWMAVTIFSIGLVVVISELDNLLNHVLPVPDYFRQMFESIIGGQTFVISIIYVGIIPAIVEELFFRGLILDGFTRNYSKWKAILMSALFFGLIHLNPWQFFTGFIMGLIAAWICIETGSILLCMFIHFFNNTIYTVMVHFKDTISIKGFNTNFATPVEFQPLWFTLSGLALLLVGSYMLIAGIRESKAAEARPAEPDEPPQPDENIS